MACTYFKGIDFCIDAGLVKGVLCRWSSDGLCRSVRSGRGVVGVGVNGVLELEAE